jgi:mono/diheme cytochrome c family protein
MIAVVGGAGALAAAAQGPAQPSGGIGLYKTYCASCHGESGRGDGPVAEHLRPRPADLTQIARKSGGTYPADAVARIIDGRQRVKPHGNSQMPVWGDAFSRSLQGGSEESVQLRVQALVRYLETIQDRPAGVR